MIRNHERKQLLLLQEIFYKTVKISVACDNECFIKVADVYHGMQNKLRVYIAFYISVRQLKGRLEDADVPTLLQIFVQTLVTFYVANAEKCFGDVIFILEINAKPCKVKFPTLAPNAEVEVLAIYECIVSFIFHNFLAGGTGRS